MATTPNVLSDQDVIDLRDIAAKLPADHPYRAKIGALLREQAGVAEKQADEQRSLGNRFRDWYTRETDVANDPYAVGKGVLPAGGFQKESPRSAIQNTALMSAVPLLGPTIAAPGAAALALGTGYVGSKAGEYLGEQVGQPELGADVGGALGAIFSPKVPGAAARVMRTPNNSIRPSLRLASKVALPAGIFHNAGPEALDMFAPKRPGMAGPGELSQAIKEGIASRIPTRLPASLRGDPFAPSEAQSSSPTSNQVTLVPEPRPLTSADRPGAKYSVERKNLPALAMRGEPGAADVLRNIQEKPILYTPREGVGYPGPRADVYAPEGIPQGTATPFESVVPIKVENSMGIRWATDGVNRISIPASVTDAEIETYARPKLAEQARIRGSLFQ